MSFLQLLAVAAAAFWTWFLFLRPNSSNRRSGKKLPPGPYPLPIIGNILHLGQLPHRTLTNFSKKHGPLLSLHFGSIYTVVVSSADVAREVFTKHDQALSSRMIPTAARAHEHHELSFAFLPVGPKWRKIRKLSKEHLFSTPRMDASEELRQEKVRKLQEYIEECCKAGQAVNVSDAVFVTTLNLLSATLFSSEGMSFDSGTAQELKSIVLGIFKVVGSPNVADFFPILQWIDPQGVKKQSELHFGKMLAYIDDQIKERIRLRETCPDLPKKTDFLETLLDMAHGNEFNYDEKNISHLLFEFVTAGADTVATVAEWTMTELLLNPDKLAKAKKELNTVLGDKQFQESDLPRLPYLQAIMKEILRFHPPGPLLIPHKAEEDVEINGYTIPEGAQILINAWAIGRDPKRWTNPDVFEPERFLNSKMDVKGQHFDLIPFGGGRRICPGMPLANRMLPIVIATLIQNFDWKLESNLKPGQVENAEKFGISVRKAVPLRATPIKIVKK